MAAPTISQLLAAVDRERTVRFATEITRLSVPDGREGPRALRRAGQPTSRAGRCEQLLTQAAPSPVETHLGRGLADAELTSNLLVRQVVNIPEHDHHPHLVRKIRECFHETLPIVGCPSRRLRVSLGARLQNLEIVVELDVGGPPALGHQRGRAVRGDAMQPCPEAGIPPELT